MEEETIIVDPAHRILSRKLTTNMALIAFFGIVLVGITVFIVIWIILKLNNEPNLSGTKKNRLGCPCKSSANSSSSASFSQATQITVNVTMKTKRNPSFDIGSAQTFTINGKEGQILNLHVGDAYTFTNNASCEYPFYISTSSVGAGAGVVSDGVTYSNGPQVCNGSSLIFTPTNQQSGQLYYYQCLKQPNMGYKINII